jgi:hypothetical protein
MDPCTVATEMTQGSAEAAPWPTRPDCRVYNHHELRLLVCRKGLAQDGDGGSENETRVKKKTSFFGASKVQLLKSNGCQR